MSFFYQTSGTINANTPLGQWNVDGFREIAVTLWFKGAGGAKVYPAFYSDNLQTAIESITLGPAPPGGWNTFTLAKVYPVFSRTLSIVLYNPSAPLEFQLRLYATCCTGDAPKAAKPLDRFLGKAVDLAGLVGTHGTGAG